MRTCSVDGCEKRGEARGWCTTHYMRWRRTGDPLTSRRILGDETARFWSYVSKTGSCWLWTGGLSHGYGNFCAEPAPGRSRAVQAHRFAYELVVGEIPAGLVLDHLCRNRACVNPAHLDPVTQQVNVLRGDLPRALRENMCVHGHDYTPENTFINKARARCCRICMRASAARARARRREARASQAP